MCMPTRRSTSCCCGNAHRDRYLPIWVGPWEASAIATRLQGVLPERPLTHDLYTRTLLELGVTIVRVVVTELAEETYRARVVVRLGEVEHQIDARPSDAIAIALRADVPIFVADAILDRVGVLPGAGAGDAPVDVPGVRQLPRGGPRRRLGPGGPGTGLSRTSGRSGRHASCLGAGIVRWPKRRLAGPKRLPGPSPEQQPEPPEVAHRPEHHPRIGTRRAARGPRMVWHAHLDHRSVQRAQLDEQLRRQERAARREPDIVAGPRAGRACRRSRRRAPGGRRRPAGRPDRRARRRAGWADRRA